MKPLIYLPFVLLLGLLIGGWLPKKELRTAKSKISDLEERIAKIDRGGSDNSRLNSLTSIIKLPERSSEGKRRPRPAPKLDHTPAPEVADNKLDEAETTPADPPPAETVETTPHPSIESSDMESGIAEAKELWQTRVSIARAQIIDELRLNAEQIASFDNAINTMNENLYHTCQEIADTIELTDDMTPELGVRAINAMTAAMVEAYDSLAVSLPAELHSETAAIELTDFIDPAVADPLLAVEHKLDRMPQRSRHTPSRRRHP